MSQGPDPDLVCAAVPQILRSLAEYQAALSAARMIPNPGDKQEPLVFLERLARDRRLTEEDALITQCERCQGWSWIYPVCRTCRTRHHRTPARR